MSPGPQAGAAAEAAEERRRERRLWAALALASVVAAVILGPPLVALSARQMKMEAARWPVTWRPVGLAMARLAESVPFAMTDRPLPFGDGWVPLALRRLHGEVRVAPGRATVTFGDPGHRFGYRLVPEPAAADARDLTWYMSYFSYRIDSQPVFERLTLPKAGAWTPAGLARRGASVYDRRLARHPDDGATLEARSLLLATLGDCRAAREATAEAARRLPEEAWPRLLLALIDQRLGRGAGAGGALAAWARAHPGQAEPFPGLTVRRPVPRGGPPPRLGCGVLHPAP